MQRTETSQSGVVTPESDLALVRAVLVGDRRAGRELAQRMRCVPRILAVLNQRRGRPLRHHDLEDLSQDALAIIWEKLSSFHGLVILERWMFRFCLFSMQNRLRRFARLHRVEGQRLGQNREEPPAPDAAAEHYEALEGHLARLPVEEAEVVRLKHYEQCTFEEIGERMKTSPNTAKTRYYRALRRIESALNGQRNGRSQTKPQQQQGWQGRFNQKGHQKIGRPTAGADLTVQIYSVGAAKIAGLPPQLIPKNPARQRAPIKAKNRPDYHPAEQPADD